MLQKTRLTYRTPSFKEGITRIFDFVGAMKDDFEVISITSDKGNPDITQVSDPLQQGHKLMRWSSVDGLKHTLQERCKTVSKNSLAEYYTEK